MPKFTLEVKVSDNNCSVSCCKNNTQATECAGVSVSEITAVDGGARDSEEKESCCCTSCHIVKYYRKRRKKKKQQQQQQKEDETAEKVQSIAEENL